MTDDATDETQTNGDLQVILDASLEEKYKFLKNKLLNVEKILSGESKKTRVDAIKCLNGDKIESYENHMFIKTGESIINCNSQGTEGCYTHDEIAEQVGTIKDMDINCNINNKTPLEEIFCRLKNDIDSLQNNSLIADYLGCPRDCECCQINDKIKKMLPTEEGFQNISDGNDEIDGENGSVGNEKNLKKIDKFLYYKNTRDCELKKRKNSKKRKKKIILNMKIQSI